MGKPLPTSSGRLPCRLKVYCQSIPAPDTQFWWQAELFDVAPEGVGLISAKPYESATGLCVEILGQRLQTRVLWTKPKWGGDWLVICSLVKGSLSEEDIRAILTVSRGQCPVSSRLHTSL